MPSTRCPLCGLVQPLRQTCADRDCKARLYSQRDVHTLRAMGVDPEQSDIEDVRQAEERRFRPLHERMKDWETED